MKVRRTQITLFVFIGIFIVFLAGILFYVLNSNNEPTQETPQVSLSAKDRLTSYVENCIYSTTVKIVDFFFRFQILCKFCLSFHFLIVEGNHLEQNYWLKYECSGINLEHVQGRLYPSDLLSFPNIFSIDVLIF